jgi:hypothetical protein
MKKLFFLFGLLLILTSCTFTESITINEDGTGNYSLDMDGSAFMAMMPKDSLTGSKEKAIDSTFSFKQLFEEKKDSIAKLSPQEQARIKKLENFRMKMKMDYEKHQFLFSMFTSFKSVTELQDVMNDMGELQKMNKVQKEQSMSGFGNASMFGNTNSKVNYFYDGKKFSRKAIVDKEALKKINNDSIEQYKMIFESSKYVLKYHFPKAVKSVSNKTALFSEDRKTITLEFSFNDCLKEPEKLNFDIVFQ